MTYSTRKQYASIFGVLICLLSATFSPRALFAESISQRIDKSDIEVGYRIQTDSEAYITLPANTFHRSLFVDFARANAPVPIPPDKDLVSPVYWYAILPAQSNLLEHEIGLNIHYDANESRWREIYVYNEELGVWQHLPGDIDTQNKNVSASTRWASGYMAVFADHLDRSEYVKASVSSQSIYVADAQTGEVLIERAGDTERPIASLTKLVTAATFLANNPGWDTRVSFQSSDDTIPAKIYVKSGETFTTQDLFYATLLKSANNAARALARSTGMPESDFVEAMNGTAEKYNMSRSHFIEPTGLSEYDVSTAHDVFNLAKSLFADPLFLRTTTPKTYTIASVDTGKRYVLTNSNKLLDIPYVVLGSKTGFTYEAGRCLVMKVKNKEGREVIAVTMGANTPGAQWDDMRILLDAALGE